MEPAGKVMMRTIVGFSLLFALLATSSARAVTFTAKAEDGTVTIYSTTTKPEVCEPWVRFTYLEEGQRKDGFTSCGRHEIKPGKNAEVCHFSNPRIVAPLLKGDVIPDCASTPKKP
jgi:hypothetical protein